MQREKYNQILSDYILKDNHILLYKKWNRDPDF